MRMPAGHDEELQGNVARRIVVGVDGSSDSLRALEWAVREARLRTATLEVVHVDTVRREVMEIFDPELLRFEQKVLDHAVARARCIDPTVSVVGRLSEPPVGKALVDASRGAELLVIGSRGLSGWNQLATGSVGSQCLHHAHCPVVMLRHGQAPAVANHKVPPHLHHAQSL